jgi:hypothetical protein
LLRLLPRRLAAAGSEATSCFSRSTRSVACRSIRSSRPPRVNDREAAGELILVPPTAISASSTNPSETSAATLSVNSRSSSPDHLIRKSESPW